MRQIELVLSTSEREVQPRQRLAASRVANSAYGEVTNHVKPEGTRYWAVTQVKELSPCSEAIYWPCGCKSHLCNSQCGKVVISDSLWGDPMAESSEVKAFNREASNQKGRSESERNKRRNFHYWSCQASRGSRRWLVFLWKELGGAHKEASGGLKAAILERSAEKARKVCKPVRMTLE